MKMLQASQEMFQTSLGMNVKYHFFKFQLFFSLFFSLSNYKKKEEKVERKRKTNKIKGREGRKKTKNQQQ